MAVTKTWKVYGADGHRQRMSFGESVRDDFTDILRIQELAKLLR